MTVDVAHSLSAALDLMKKNHFAAIMLDLTLPDSKGLDTVVQVSRFQPTLPIVVLTATEGEDIGYLALQSGAQDYLVKGDADQKDVERSLRYAIERKKQSNRVLENEQRLRGTIENSYSAFLSVSEDLTLTEWNSRAEELFGYSANEVIGQKILDKLFRTSGWSLVEELRNYFCGKESNIVGCRREVGGIHRSGKQFPAEVAFFAVKQGESRTLCSFVADITHRKEFERHTAEFYSLVAHELRTPLTSIRGAMSLLKAHVAEPEEEAELLESGMRSCERLVNLINDLLDLSKFEAGKMPLHKKVCSSTTLVSRAVQECHGFASDKGVSIETSVPVEFKLHADPDRIVQVLINLISNAVKYSPVGAAVNVSCKLAPQRRVHFSITDQGPGIPQDGVSKLFQKFQQVQADTNIQQEGTGLGLAISKMIVSHHRGDIGVDSEPGKGATFWFELPGLDDDQEDTA